MKACRAGESEQCIAEVAKAEAKQHQAVQCVSQLADSYIELTEAGRKRAGLGWSWRKIQRRRTVKGSK